MVLSHSLVFQNPDILEDRPWYEMENDQVEYSLRPKLIKTFLSGMGFK